MVSYYFGLMLLPFFSVNLKWLILECFQYKFPCQHTKSSLFQRLWKYCIPWSNIWNIFHTLGNHWYFECVYRNLWFSDIFYFSVEFGEVLFNSFMHIIACFSFKKIMNLGIQPMGSINKGSGISHYFFNGQFISLGFQPEGTSCHCNYYN